MRLLPLAAIFAVGLVVAQDDPFLKGDDLKAAIERDCAEGCITFNRQEAQELQEALNALIAERQREAYQAGIAHQKQACRSPI